MRILLINDNYSHVGGAETYFLDLYQLLKENKNNTYIFSMGKKEIKSTDIFVALETTAKKRLCESENLKDISTWLLRKFITQLNCFDTGGKTKTPPGFQIIAEKYRYIQLFGNYYIDTTIEDKLRDWINKINPSIIHIHNNYKYSSSIYSSIKNLKIPVVKTVHDFGMICPTSRCIKPDGEICKGSLGRECVEAGCISNRHYTLIKPANKIVSELEKSSVALFITPSRILKKKMEEYGFNNVVHLPNFINPNKYCVGASTFETGTILYIGSLENNKGVRYLIEAFPCVLKEFPDAKLNIAGSGTLRQCLEERARQLGIRDYVLFHGKVSGEKVKELYRRANVIVVPSIWIENSPMVIYEAMASGRPVIGSNIGGIPEMIYHGETGYLTEPRNPEDIAKKVIKIISDRNLTEKLGKTAREIILNEYSPEKHYEGITKIYKMVIKR